MQKKTSILNGVLFITQGSGVRGDRNFPLASPGTAVHVSGRAGEQGPPEQKAVMGR